MKIDKETKKYLDDRVKINSPNHHELSPVELRKARLAQLALDDLKGPELENIFDLKHYQSVEYKSCSLFFNSFNN